VLYASMIIGVELDSYYTNNSTTEVDVGVFLSYSCTLDKLLITLQEKRKSCRILERFVSNNN